MPERAGKSRPISDEKYSFFEGHYYQEVVMFPNRWEVTRRVQETHQQDLMRQAEQFRLQQEALSGITPATPLAGRFFSWLGRQMVNMGRAMQRHYAELAGQSNLPGDEPCGC
jgi:hypothetical protein